MASLEAADDAGLEALGYRQELSRSLTLVDLTVYGLVFMVPLAALLNFGFVYNASQGMAPLVYLVGLAAMLFTATSYVTMSRTFPVAGSVYAYAGLGIGPAAGFMAGWAMLLDYLLMPALCYVNCAAALNAVLPWAPKPAWVMLLLGGVTAVNLVGVQLTALVNKALLLVQLVFLAVFVVLGVAAVRHGVGGAHLSLAPLWDPARMSPGLIFGGLSMAAVSFLGFDAVSTMSEESRGGSKAVGRATLLSLLLIGVLFVGQTYLACLLLLDHGPFADGDATATAHLYVGQLIGGPGFKLVMAGLVVAVAGVPCALVAQAATARLLFSMARDGRLPRALARIDSRFQTPQRAVLLVSGATLVLSLALVNRLDVLFLLVSFGALAGFLMVHLSVLVHHGWRGRSRRWVAHVASPVLGFAIIAYVLASIDPLAKIVGGGWLALGATVMIALKRRPAAP